MRHYPLFSLLSGGWKEVRDFALCLVCVLYGRVQGGERQCSLFSLKSVWKATGKRHCSLFCTVWKVGNKRHSLLEAGGERHY